VAKKERINIHELLSRKKFDHGFICTYSFDPVFFEEYCLEKFNSLADNGNITVALDQRVYETIIIWPISDRPKQANLRYLLYPITVPGAFHTKIFLFISKDIGRLILGSGNFTRPGITSNAELVACYDFEIGKDELFKPIFQEVYAFLSELTRRYQSKALLSNLQAISRDATWITPSSKLKQLTNQKFIHNLDIPLWDQLISSINQPVETIFILSRYFDAKPNVIDKVNSGLTPKIIKIFTQNNITTLSTDWLKHPLFKSNVLEISLCTYSDKEHTLPLHAKAVAFQTNNEVIIGFGSANFTTSAMFSSAQKGNVETLVIIRAKREEIDIDTLFDPDKTAVALKDDGTLQTAPRDEELGLGKYEIDLIEAILNEGEIILAAEVPEKFNGYSLTAKLTFGDNFQQRLQILSRQNGNYTASISGEVTQRLGKSSTTIQIEATQKDQVTVISNPILITNLIDIHSGQSVKRERFIKEAQQSVIQFFEILNELIKSGDDKDLLIFLTYCDIPIKDALRPIFFKGARPVWNGTGGMRHLGDRNLLIFTNLHDAAIMFFDRHLMKLKHHIDYGGINGIANFMHISLAVGGILYAQMERIVQGLESVYQPIDPHDWFVYRGYFNIYFLKFKDLVSYICQQYLLKMIRDYGLKEVLERLLPEYDSLLQLYSDMFNFKSRIDALRKERIRIKTAESKIVIPQYYNCLLGKNQWPGYSEQINKMFQELKKVLALKDNQ